VGTILCVCRVVATTRQHVGVGPGGTDERRSDERNGQREDETTTLATSTFAERVTARGPA